MAAGTAVAPQWVRDEVLVGQAAVRLFPLDGTATAALPSDDVPINGTWPVGWIPIGATEEGVTLKFSRSTEAIRIEESAVAIDQRTTEVTFSVDAVLSQNSLRHMKLAFGGGTIKTEPATVDKPSVSKLTVSRELDQFALGFEGKNEFGLPRRILIPVVLSVADAEAQFRRASAPQRWSVSFMSLVDVEDCDIRDVVAPKLAA